MKFYNTLNDNVNLLKSQLTNCDDIKFRNISVNNNNLCIIYTAEMVDKQLLTLSVLNPLINSSSYFDDAIQNNNFEYALENILPVGELAVIYSVENCIDKILNGYIILLSDNINYAVSAGVDNYENRSIEPPQSEPSIKGPKDSFTESLETNVSLIRRRLLHKDCKCKTIIAGKYSKTKIAVIYIDSLANKKMVDEVFRRLYEIKNENLLDVSYIEELIEDNPSSPYPTALITERPDKSVSMLLDGRIVILQDNSPGAVIVPCILMDFFQRPSDYYQKHGAITLFRYIRYFGILITDFLPSIYIAITTFNQELLPTRLLITLAKQREGVPLPAALEAFLMYIAFLIVREAGANLPSAIGQTVSIVGGFIIGDSTVRAGLVSPAIVVVTALAGMTSFLVPTTQLGSSTGIIKLSAILASSILGIWGIFIVFILNIGHLVSLRSLGVPYMSPVSPLIMGNLDDVLSRAPIWKLNKNPLILRSHRYRNQIEHIKKH